jgi:hypothetical protein
MCRGATAGPSKTDLFAPPQSSKKGALKVAGASSLAFAAQHAYCAHEKTIKPEVAYSFVAVNLVLGGLALWHGFKEDAKEEVKQSTTKLI